MKPYIVLLCLILLAGCENTNPPKDIVAKVGVYEVTREEFEEGFLESTYGQQNTPESKAAFLKNLINQKLILLDAQQRGLDKNKEFLKMVENFWQQSLLTAALQEKAKQGVDLDKWVESLKQNTPIQINEEAFQ